MQRRVTESGREEEKDLGRGRNAEEDDVKWKRRRGRFCEGKE